MTTFEKNAIGSKEIGGVLVVKFPDGKCILKSNLSGKKLQAWLDNYGEQAQEFLGRELHGQNKTKPKATPTNPVYISLKKEIGTLSLQDVFGFKGILKAYESELSKAEYNTLMDKLKRQMSKVTA